MIYRCLVIDNSNFYETGKIRVRIEDKSIFINSMKDLAINPKETVQQLAGEHMLNSGTKKTLKYTDTDAYVSTNIGGGYDYGVFYLPQPNTWGLVSVVGANYDPEYVWLGSIIMPNESSSAENFLDIPSDKISDENKNGCNDRGTSNIDNPYSSFVFKQKETHIVRDNNIVTDESKETLDWKNRPLFNMVVLNKDKIRVYHNILDKDNNIVGVSDAVIDSNGVNVKYENTENNNKSLFSMETDGSIEMSSETTVNKSIVTNKLKATPENLEIQHLSNNVNGTIFMGEDKSASGVDIGGGKLMKIQFTEDKATSQIILNKTGIKLDSKKSVIISCDDIQLSSAGSTGYLVFADSVPLSGGVNIDGVNFKVAKKISNQPLASVKA